MQKSSGTGTASKLLWSSLFAGWSFNDFAAVLIRFSRFRHFCLFQHSLPRIHTRGLSWATKYNICHVCCSFLDSPPSFSFSFKISKSSHEVQFRYDNLQTRCAENSGVKILCVVSCLWIIGWPLKYMLGYDDDASLTAYYRLVIEFRMIACVCLAFGDSSHKRHAFIWQISHCSWNLLSPFY